MTSLPPAWAQETFTILLDADKDWTQGVNWAPSGTPAHTFPGENPLIIDDIAIINASVTGTVLDLNGANLEIGVLNLAPTANSINFDLASSSGQATLTLSEIHYGTTGNQEIDFRNSVSVVGKSTGLLIDTTRTNIDFDTSFTALGDLTVRGDEFIFFDNRDSANVAGQTAFSVAGALVIDQTNRALGIRGYNIDGATRIAYDPTSGLPEPVVGSLHFINSGQLEFDRTGGTAVSSLQVLGDATLAHDVVNWRGLDGYRTQLRINGNLVLDNGDTSVSVNTYDISRLTTHGATQWSVGGVVTGNDTLVWNGQGRLLFDASGGAGGTARTGDTIIDGGVIELASDFNPLGSGNVTVNDFASLMLNRAAQTEIPGTVSVNAYGGIGGDLTNATYGTNVILHANAAVGAFNGNDPDMSVVGQTLFQGVTPLARSTVLNFDSGSAYKGAAFGAFSDFSDGTASNFYYNGTLETTEAGRDLNILVMDNSGRVDSAVDNPFNITSIRSQDGLVPELNSATGVVNIYSSGILELRSEGTDGLDGNFTTLNYFGERELSLNEAVPVDGQGLSQSRLLLTENSSSDNGQIIHSGQTLNVFDAALQISNGASRTLQNGAVINIGDRGLLYLSGTIQAAAEVNLLANSATFINGNNRFNTNAVYNVVDPSTLGGNDFAHLLVLDNKIDLTQNADLAAVAARSDLVFHDTSADDHILVLGQGRKISTTYVGTRDLAAGGGGSLTVAGDTTHVSLSAARRELDNAELVLDINADSVVLSNDANNLNLMVGDLYHYLTYGGDGLDNRLLINQFGRVDLGSANGEYDNIELVSGELNLGDAVSDNIVVHGDVRMNSTTGDRVLLMQGNIRIAGNVLVNTNRVEIDRIGAPVGVGELLIGGNVIINDADFLVDDTTNTNLSQTLLDGRVASEIVVSQRGQFEFQLSGAAQGDASGNHVVQQAIRILGINDRFGTVAPPQDNSQINVNLTANTGFTGENNVVLLQNVTLAAGAQLGINTNSDNVRASLMLEGDGGVNQMGGADSFDLLDVLASAPGSPRRFTVGERSSGNAVTGHFATSLFGQIGSDVALELRDTTFTVDGSLGGAGVLGQVILNGIASTDALQTLNGGIIAASADYDFRQGTVGGVLGQTGVVGLMKTTGGTVILRGEDDGLGLGNFFDAANTFSGDISVLAGTLQLHGSVSGDGLTPSALGLGTSAIVLGDTSGSLDAALVFGAKDAVNSTADFVFDRDITVQAGSSGAKIIGLLANNGETATYNGAITLGDTLHITAGAGDTTVLSGSAVISGTPGVNIVGEGIVDLQAANLYSGDTVVRGGGLRLSGSGAITNSPAITVFTASGLSLDNSGTNVLDRLGDTASITLTDGGHFELIGNAAAASSETVGSLSIARGANRVTVAAGAGQSASVTFANLVRPLTGTVLFRGSNLGSTPGADVANIFFATAPSAATFVGGNGAAGTTNISIIPFAIGDASASGLGNTLVTYDAAGGVRPLDIATELAHFTDAASFAALNADDNVRAVLTAGGISGLAGRTVNALVIDNSSGSAASFTGSGALSITSGAILLSGADEITLGGFDSIESGGAQNELVIHNADANQTVHWMAPIGNDDALVYGGLGTLAIDAITSGNSTRTGNTVVNGGRLLLVDSTPAPPGSTGSVNKNSQNLNPFGNGANGGDIVLNGAILELLANGSAQNSQVIAYDNDVVINRDSTIRFGNFDGSAGSSQVFRFGDLRLSDGVTLQIERSDNDNFRFRGNIDVASGGATLELGNSLTLSFDNASTMTGSGDLTYRGGNASSVLQFQTDIGHSGGFSGRIISETNSDIQLFVNEGTVDAGTTHFADVGGTGGFVLNEVNDFILRTRVDRTVFSAPVIWNELDGDLVVQADTSGSTTNRMGNEVHLLSFTMGPSANVDVQSGAGHDYFLTVGELTLAGDGAIFEVAADPTAWDDPGDGLGTELVGITRPLFEVDTINDNGNGYGFRKLGSGTMVLRASSTIGGAIDVEDGVLDVRADGALGSTLYGVIVDDDSDNNGQIRFTNVDYFTDEQIKIRTNGTNGEGAMVGVGISEFAGRIQVGDSVNQSPRIGTINATDVFTISGDVQLFSGSDLELNGPGRIHIGGTITSATASGSSNTAGTDVIIMGGATVHLSAFNGYHGETIIQHGTLEIGNHVQPKTASPLGDHNTPLVLGVQDGIGDVSFLIDGNWEMGRHILAQAGQDGIATIGTTAGTSSALISGDIELQRSVVLSAATGSTLDIAGELFGDGDVNIDGGGDVVFSSPLNRYSGNTSVRGGSRLSIGSQYQLGGSTLTLDGGTLRTTNSMFFNANTISLGAGGGTLDVADSQIVTYEGNITGTGGLTKIGGGTASLIAGVTYNYDGATNINDGTLLVNGTLGSGGGVLVNSGATLAGSGTIIGNLTINSGSTVSPGNSPGQLSAGDTAWDGNSTFLMEMNHAAGVAGVNWDLLAVTGILTINSTVATPIVLDVNSLMPDNTPGAMASFDPLQSYIDVWSFATATGGISLTSLGVGETINDLFQVDATDLVAYFPGAAAGQFTVSMSGGSDSLYLNYTAVPEPGSWLLAALAGLGMAGYGWRRKRKPATPERQND